MTHGIESSNDKLVFFVGVNTGLVTDGVPDQRFIEFYRARSSPDLHCAIVGNVVVPGGHGSNSSTPSIREDSVWARIADAMRFAGSLPGIQLASAWAGYHGAKKFLSVDGNQVIARARELSASLSPSDLDRIIDAFATGAAMAVEYGYGHVQVHAAHGYLLSLLVDDRINPAADRVLERLSKIAEWLKSRGVESSIRISMKTGEPSFDREGATEFHRTVSALPFDFIDLSSGFYNIDKRLIYPSRPDFVEQRLLDSVEIALRHPERNFIISGRMLDRGDRLPHNAHLGVCRDLIANPGALNDPSNGCQNHGKCHYYSRGKPHVTCKRWAELLN
ncbi:hypothetical protein GRI97_16320 [Altererythrobacter xixiisoli]|uniref:NADH:flavin oxidoreductase/NADH oxidase N-terminal domain-containing protein n=1 Tax=Croceibacterium xixiisoli TaxID=1476466 RepID=A0A6I4TX07_9SPHN|nr:hypothetical protein [Croceibacterium xixiisoli]MXP00557.1 hypothetical protein [Croceibacterium xixiisoli]